jgi:uridine kinase
VLLDGLWLLRRKAIRPLIGLSVYLDCPTEVRFKRRLARDRATRGRAPSSVRDQFRKTVEPMHARFVAPQRHLVDLILSHGFGERDVRHLARKLGALIGDS